MQKRIIAIALLALGVLQGCSEQDTDKIKQMNQLEGEAQAEAQLVRDREAARIMEQDLATRFDFYEANSGHFEGWLTNGATKYKIRISLYPNLPRYRGTRLRSQEEVQSDLTTLAMNAQITQWNPQIPAAGAGCRVENLRPDIVDGTLNIISSSCPSSYFLVLDRTEIKGTAQPSTQPTIFDLQADRLP